MGLTDDKFDRKAVEINRDLAQLDRLLGESQRSPRCRGLMGMLRGHLFVESTMGVVFQTFDFCRRCGWKPPRG